MTRQRLVALGVATVVVAALYGLMRLALGRPWWSLFVLGLAAGCAYRLAVELPVLKPVAEAVHQRATDWLRAAMGHVR
jgi:hypothetical protein